MCGASTPGAVRTPHLGPFLTRSFHTATSQDVAKREAASAPAAANAAFFFLLPGAKCATAAVGNSPFAGCGMRMCTVKGPSPFRLFSPPSPRTKVASCQLVTSWGGHPFPLAWCQCHRHHGCLHCFGPLARTEHAMHSHSCRRCHRCLVRPHCRSNGGPIIHVNHSFRLG